MKFEETAAILEAGGWGLRSGMSFGVDYPRR